MQPNASVCLYCILSQVKDLEQRLSEVTDSKVYLEESLKTSERSTRSLEAELQSSKTTLESTQAELKEIQDKVSKPFSLHNVQCKVCSHLHQEDVGNVYSTIQWHLLSAGHLSI